MAESRFKGESFTVGSGDQAVLLIHGFTASTQEMESLGLAIAAAGFSVLAPLLPGHNRDFSAFQRTAAADYYKHIEACYHDLAGRFRVVHAVGLSFGAALALRLAARQGLKKVAILAPALFYRNPLTKLAGWLQIYRGKMMKRLKNNRETGIASRWDLFRPEAIEERIAYPWFALPQLQSTRRFAREVIKELPALKSALLIMHSRRDSTAHPRGAQYVHDHAGAPEKRLIFLERSGHIITEDYEADQIREEVLKFLRT